MLSYILKASTSRGDSSAAKSAHVKWKHNIKLFQFTHSDDQLFKNSNNWIVFSKQDKLSKSQVT